jgi:hypothetical protein
LAAAGTNNEALFLQLLEGAMHGGLAQSEKIRSLFQTQ